MIDDPKPGEPTQPVQPEVQPDFVPPDHQPAKA